MTAQPPSAVRRSPSIDPAVLGIPGCAAGTVHLVGAGPGDPGLLTLHAAALLATADVVAYDHLAPRAVLTLVPATAERICVGKAPGRHSWPQADIGRLLVDEAHRGRAVVRLKGGDPFVFGRGGEEVLDCLAAGVPCRVVSGVTSAVAAPAAAGVPVTHRGVASAVAFVTGHEDPRKPDTAIDLDALAAFPGTLVFLMGVRNAARIAAGLVAGGRRRDEPVAVVHRGTTDDQAVLRTSLDRLADDLVASGVGSPATIVVGDVSTVLPHAQRLAAPALA